MDGPEVEIEGLGDGPEELIDVFDERAQANSDAEQLVNAMKQIRTQLSVAKINLRMAQRGLLTGEGIHPEQIKKDVKRSRDAIEQLKALWESMGPEGFAETTIDTYASVSQVPLTEPAPIP